VEQSWAFLDVAPAALQSEVRLPQVLSAGPAASHSPTFQVPVLDAIHLGGLATFVRYSGLLQDSKPIQDTFYNQDDPSIREDVLDSRLGGSVPRVLWFFLRILWDKMGRTSD
jgi:hypothetical protein